MRILRIFLKLILRLSLYRLSCIFLILLLYTVYSMWSESLLEIESNSRCEVTDDIHIVPESEYPSIVAYHSILGSNGMPISCPHNLKCEYYESNHRLRDNVGGAYLFYATSINFTDLPLPRRPENTFWAFMHEESPRNVEMFLQETSLALFNFSSTYSRYSDVPFPLHQMGTLEEIVSTEFFVETAEKNSLLNELAPILYIQSDCETSSERDTYVKDLMKYLRIDSYGKCLQNKPKLPFDTEEDYLNNFKSKEYQRFIARYKFHIAIENGVCNDYVTEKFWRPIHLGSVPIYFGSPLIRDWLPNNKSAILIEDFPSPKLLSNYINRLMANDTLYEEHLEHKTKGLISNQRIIAELKERPYQSDSIETIKVFKCFVCKKLHELRLKPERHIVTKKHYDCPKPVSALTLDVNSNNPWVSNYDMMKDKADRIYKFISEANDSESYLKRLSELPYWWLS